MADVAYLPAGKRELTKVQNRQAILDAARELFAFADACLLDGAPLISLAPPVLANGMLSAVYGPERKLRAARLLATPDSGGWPEREWFVLPAEIDPERRRVSARLPDGATAACLSIVSEDWLTSTSDVVFPPSSARERRNW